MLTKNFETSDTPHITVKECAGDLTILGSDAKQVIVEVEGEEDDLVVERQGEALSLAAHCPCDLSVPVGASVTLHQVSGNLRVRGVTGPLAIQAVFGNVSLCDAGPAVVDAASGNLEARQVQGDLSLKQVNGNVTLRRIEGALALERCSGNLNARDLLGGAHVQDLHGNIWLNSALTAGREYNFRAHGNIKSYFPVDSSARCAFEAGGNMQCDLELSGGERTERRVAGQLGAGEALLDLHADGNVSVQGDEREWGADFGAYIEAMVEAGMTDLEQHLQEELSGLGDIGPNVEEKVRRKVERAAERARYKVERAAERARRKAEKTAERTRRKAEKTAAHHTTAGFQFTWDKPSEPERAPAGEPVSSDERLMILRMVEDKKISTEEAALLLEALEGQAG